jgi:inorganic pyrophosphatase
MTEKYWTTVETLINSSKIVIDRPKGSSHPRYPTVVYPLDYGYLERTSSGDGNGIDVWIGSDKDRKLSAILCTVDKLKEIWK